MRQDLPEPVRRNLDQQRKQFVTEIGAAYEELLERRIDPTEWMAAVMSVTAAVKAAGDEGR